jgi:hypothetical protein
MTDVRKALEAERNLEREFVTAALKAETRPKGWPAAILMFHLSMWRERLRNALADFRDGRPYTPPPANIDEFNDAEIAGGLGTPLADMAGRSDKLLDELIALYEQVGDRPFEWYVGQTTTEALLRNSYVHPRVHVYEYWIENGERDRAHQLFEDAVSDMRDASAPPLVLGTVLYNLAIARVDQDRVDDALELLVEAFPMRADLKDGAASDPDLAPLHDNPGFKALVKR